MQSRKKILAGILAGTMVLGACPAALAASYNDSSVTGGSAEWQSWVSQWEKRGHRLHQGIPHPRC